MVRSKQQVRVKIESIMHCPGRMMRGQVQRLEIVIVIFNLGTFNDVITDTAEEVFNSPEYHGHRMMTAKL